MEWIKVEDKLPERDQDVLATIHVDGIDDFVDTVMYLRREDGFYDWNNEYGEFIEVYGRVVAWAPLPEPFKDAFEEPETIEKKADDGLIQRGDIYGFRPMV